MSKMLRGLILIEEERLRKKKIIFHNKKKYWNWKNKIISYADKQGQLVSFVEVDEKALI